MRGISIIADFRPMGYINFHAVVVVGLGTGKSVSEALIF